MSDKDRVDEELTPGNKVESSDSRKASTSVASASLLSMDSCVRPKKVSRQPWKLTFWTYRSLDELRLLLLERANSQHTLSFLVRIGQ